MTHALISPNSLLTKLLTPCYAALGPRSSGWTLQSGAKDARFVEETMIYNGCNIPFLSGNGAEMERHGRFASTAWIGAAVRIHIVTALPLADIPGSSVPSGRRLRR